MPTGRAGPNDIFGYRALLADESNAATAETVIGRIASGDDVANVVAFLCSDYSRHVTGEVIKVDGGQYI